MKSPGSELLSGLFVLWETKYRMWYFLIRQNVPATNQYQELQKKAILTEVELFNEPYNSWYVFTVEKTHYMAFIDYLDREGIEYSLMTDRPTRQELLQRMR